MKKILLLLFALISIQSINAQKISDHVEGEVLVSVAPNADINRLVQKFQNYQGLSTGLKVVELVAKPMNIWRLTFDAKQIDEEDMLFILRSQGEIKVAQFNHILEARVKTPNDSLFSKQWQWKNEGATGGKADADIDADEAWSITTGGFTPTGDTIVVAVIDNGTDLTHPDLQKNLWRNNYEIPNNKIDDDGNGYVDDYLGWNHSQKNDAVGSGSHGVSVNGMIGAVGNNKSGVSGINWNVKIMNIAPFPNSSDESTVLAAYSYAYTMRKIYNESNGKKGAFVVATNLSWGKDYGKPADAPIWCAFYDTLGTVGILNCGATSNNSSVNVDVDSDLPTACPSNFMLSVQNSDFNDNNKSAYGKTQIDVAAPGNQIYTTAAGGKYTTTSGTSFASPLVAGLVALAYSSPCAYLPKQTKSNPAATALAIKQYIMQSVDPVASLSSLNVSGGRVNAFNTLNTIATFCSACIAPSITAQVNNTSIIVSWNSPDSMVNANVRYRVLGSNVWTSADKKVSPFAALNLEKCTNYEFQIQSNCVGGTQSNWSPIIILQTDGCCETPTLQVINFGKTTLTLDWTTAPTDISHDLQYKLSTASTYTTLNNVKPPFVLANLDSCKSYTIQVRTVCNATNTTDWSTLADFKTYGCGNCLDLPYCVPSTFSASFEYIKRVKFNTINKGTSGSAGGYIAYNNLNTKVNTGSNYKLQVIPGFSSTTSTVLQYINAWIDFNQDGVFDPVNEIVSKKKTGFGVKDTLNDVVFIPWDAKFGATRMRIGSQADLLGDGFNLGPCDESKAYGEFEDYCIEIVNGFTPCGKVSNLSFNDKNQTIIASWDTIPGAISYNVQYRKFGDMDWKLENTAKGPFKFNVEPCTKYEVQVRTICMNDISDFTDTKIVEYCTTSAKETDLLVEGLNVFPVPFNNKLYTAFTLLQNSDVKIDVYNSAGQLMWSKSHDNLDASRHEIEIDNIQGWATGLYWIKIATAGGNSTKKVMKVD